MYHGFDTDDEHAAVGSLLVYAIWRSRGRSLKISPDIWGQVERYTASAAKRATELAEFIEKLKPRVHCSSLQPRWCKTTAGETISMHVDPLTGEVTQKKDKARRQFLTEILSEADHKAVLETLYRRTSYVILLVRDRLERERPYEATILAEEEVHA